MFISAYFWGLQVSKAYYNQHITSELLTTLVHIYLCRLKLSKDHHSDKLGVPGSSLSAPHAYSN